MHPLENSGKQIDELAYSATEDQKLTDQHVQALAQALLDNHKFKGTLRLDGNGISDLAILAVADVLRKPGHQNITKLVLEGNPALTCKAGEYIGQALIDNHENSALRELDFNGISLGQVGLCRVIDAANKTPSLEKLNVGVLTDSCLHLLAERLQGNKTLQTLEF